tara:strand:+ start:1104 stop:1613 length:510 start_codon:yes stop_codon:yes gene_type:complete
MKMKLDCIVRLRWVLLNISLIAGAFSACDSTQNSADSARRTNLKAVIFDIDADALSNPQTTESGLQFIVVEEGSGESPPKGSKVRVHYTGMLEDGTIFDNSYERDEPLEFNVGTGQVIAGWDEGIGLMKTGAKYRLIIPPELGYGSRGAGGVIPPNATLIFDVELLAFV